jgi:hypothetical protein
MNNNNNEKDTILFYSKYCEVCKRYLQQLARTDFHQHIHFICIDKRTKENNKTYIILEDGNKIPLPENVSKVPALFLLRHGCQVLYGEQIMNYFKSIAQQETKQATQNNMEPLAFSLGNSVSSIASDKYSYLDQDPDDLGTHGNGGMRQMHNYMDINSAFNGKLMESPFFDNHPANAKGSNNNGNNNNNGNYNSNNGNGQPIPTDFNTTIRGMRKDEDANQVMEDRIKKMKEERDADIRTITGNRPPMSY